MLHSSLYVQPFSGLYPSCAAISIFVPSSILCCISISFLLLFYSYSVPVLFYISVPLLFSFLYLCSAPIPLSGSAPLFPSRLSAASLFCQFQYRYHRQDQYATEKITDTMYQIKRKSGNDPADHTFHIQSV